MHVNDGWQAVEIFLWVRRFRWVYAMFAGGCSVWRTFRVSFWASFHSCRSIGIPELVRLFESTNFSVLLNFIVRLAMTDSKLAALFHRQIGFRWVRLAACGTMLKFVTKPIASRWVGRHFASATRRYVQVELFWANKTACRLRISAA